MLALQLHISSVAPGRPGRIQRSRLGSAQVCVRAARPAAGSPSFDSADELDKDLAMELINIADPKRMEKMKRHYELLWRVEKAAKAPKTKNVAQQCECCCGSGEQECDWCHGTGFLTVGDKIFTSNNNGKCPVCKGTGYVKCEFCRGTGSRAMWLGPDDPQAHRGQTCKRK